MLPPPTAWRFSVAADINSKVFDFYFLIWSLSRLLCCVGSGSDVAALLDSPHTYGGASQGSLVLSSDTLCFVLLIEVKVQGRKDKWRSGSTAPLIPNLAAE
jgi:hypothetical protein